MNVSRRILFSIIRGTFPCLLLGAIALQVSACVASHETTITLAGIEAEAALNQPPVFVTDGPKKGMLELSAAIVQNSESTVRGSVSETLPPSISGADSLFPQGVGNVIWNRSRGMAAVNLHYMVGKVWALTGGVTYAWGFERGLWGGNVGIGLLSDGETIGFRADVGVQIRSISQEALTLVTTKVTDLDGTQTTSSALFLDNTRSTAFDFYGSVTLNTSFDTFPLNFFVNAAVSHQTITSFVPEDQIAYSTFRGTVIVNDERADLDASVFLLTPGIMARIGDSHRILAGVRLVSMFDTKEIGTQSSLSPFLQLHFILSPGSE